MNPERKRNYRNIIEPEILVGHLRAGGECEGAKAAHLLGLVLLCDGSFVVVGRNKTGIARIVEGGSADRVVVDAGREA